MKRSTVYLGALFPMCTASAANAFSDSSNEAPLTKPMGSVQSSNDEAAPALDGPTAEGGKDPINTSELVGYGSKSQAGSDFGSDDISPPSLGHAMQSPASAALPFADIAGGSYAGWGDFRFMTDTPTSGFGPAGGSVAVSGGGSRRQAEDKDDTMPTDLAVPKTDAGVSINPAASDITVEPLVETVSDTRSSTQQASEPLDQDPASSLTDPDSTSVDQPQTSSVADDTPDFATGNEDVAEPDLSDSDSMMILLAGYANAEGDNAQTSGQVDIDVIDYGAITVGYGFATFTATQESGPLGTATAGTMAEVYGADLSYTFTVDHDLAYEAGAHASHTSTSTTYVVAIDFEDGEFGGADLAASQLWNGVPPELIQFMDFDDGAGVHISGNAADVVFNAAAQGAQDEISLAADTAATEDTSSTVALDAVIGASDLTLNAMAFGIDTIASADGSLISGDDYAFLTAGIIIGA